MDKIRIILYPVDKIVREFRNNNYSYRLLFPKFPNWNSMQIRNNLSLQENRTQVSRNVFPQIFNILPEFIDEIGRAAAFNFETTLVLYTWTRCTRVIRVQPCTGLPSYVTVNDVAYLHTGTRSTYVANFTNSSKLFNVFLTCEVYAWGANGPR